MSRQILILLLALWVGGMEVSTAVAREEEVFTKEWGGSVGINSMLDDTHSGWLSNPHLSLGGTLRFILNPRMALRTDLGWNRVSGSTSGVRDFYPAHKGVASGDRLNYSYSGSVIDLTASYELHFLPYGFRSGYQNHRRLVPFLQMGLGFAYGTAGRTLSPWVPIGVGAKYKLNARFNLTIDWSMRFSLTDRFDGLDAPHGMRSDFFRNQDHVGQLRFTLTYDFSPRCPTCNKAD